MTDDAPDVERCYQCQKPVAPGTGTRMPWPRWNRHQDDPTVVFCAECFSVPVPPAISGILGDCAVCGKSVALGEGVRYPVGIEQERVRFWSTSPWHPGWQESTNRVPVPYYVVYCNAHYDKMVPMSERFEEAPADPPPIHEQRPHWGTSTHDAIGESASDGWMFDRTTLYGALEDLRDTVEEMRGTLRVIRNQKDVTDEHDS